MKQYWEAVQQSQLLDDSKKRKAVSYIKSLSAAQKQDKSALGKWLIEQGWISSYHHENLMMSLPGPFRFGPVLVHDQLRAPAFQEFYAAQVVDSDRNHSYPAVASFVEEESEKLLDSLQKNIDRFCGLKHPHLLPPLGFLRDGKSSLILESPSNFWGVEAGSGFWDVEKAKSRPLSELLLPRKGFALKSALQIAADLACSLYALEQNQTTHFFVTPASVIIGPKSRAVFRLTPDTGIFGEGIFNFLDRIFPCNEGQLENATIIDTGKRKPTIKVGALPAQDVDQILSKTMEDRRWSLADYLPKQLLETLVQFQEGKNPSPENWEKVARKKNQFSIGVLLYQMLAGHLPFEGDTLEQKITAREQAPLEFAAEIPEKVKDILWKLLKSEEDLSTEKIATFLYKSLSTEPFSENPFSKSDRSEEVRKILLDANRLHDTNKLEEAEKIAVAEVETKNPGEDEIDSESEDEATTVPQGDPNNPFAQMKVEGRVAKGRKKNGKKRKKASPVLIGAIIAGIVGLVGAGVYFSGFGQGTEGGSQNSENQAANKSGAGNGDTAGSSNTSHESSGSEPDDGWAQKVVSDDGKRLWESPTTGAPIDKVFLPNGPSAVLFLNPSVFDQPSVAKVLQAFRLSSSEVNFPPLGFSAEQWKKWEQISVGIYDRDNERFDRVVAANSSSEVLLSLGDWKSVASLKRNGKQKGAAVVLRNNRFPGISAVCFTESIDAETESSKKISELESGSKLEQTDIPDPVSTKRLMFCDHQAIGKCLEESATGSLDRAMGIGLSMTDKDRHLQVLFSPATLKGPKAEWLMERFWKKIPRVLQMHWPLGIRSNYLSAHWDSEGACYVEAKFALDSRQKSGGFVLRLKEKLQKVPEEVELEIRKFPPHPSWDKILVKYDDMVSDFFGRLRFGFHNKFPVVNTWLPPGADHNLVAGTAVYLYGSGEASSVAVSNGSNQKNPKISSIEDILAQKLDLDIPEQDLVNAVAELKTDIMTEYKGLEFEFDIRLDGNALKADGITQNQKITNFVAKQLPISEILTNIAVTANPDQNVSEANDPNCKLIWVIRKEGKNQSILFTTRSAAKAAGWEVPEVFAAGS